MDIYIKDTSTTEPKRVWGVEHKDIVNGCWSDDLKRGEAFGIEGCKGKERFVIIGYGMEPNTPDEFDLPYCLYDLNQGYPKELLDKCFDFQWPHPNGLEKVGGKTALSRKMLCSKNSWSLTAQMAAMRHIETVMTKEEIRDWVSEHPDWHTTQVVEWSKGNFKYQTS